MARYAPALSPSELRQMTPADTRFLAKQVSGMLKEEADERFAITKVLAQAAAARRV